MVIEDSTGNVGIGNSGPDAELHVQGGACIDTDDVCTDPGDGNLTAHSLIATTGIDLAGDYRTSWPTGGGNTSAEMRAAINGSDSWFNIVGIGTASPTDSLHITGTTGDNTPDVAGIGIAVVSNYARIELASGSGSYIDFSKADGTDYKGRIFYSISSNTMRFETNGVPAITIDSSQHVGIGTSNPFQEFEVIGDMNATGNLYIGSGGICVDSDGVCTPQTGNISAINLIATTGIDLAGDYRTSWPSGGGNTTSEIWAVVDNDTFLYDSGGDTFEFNEFLYTGTLGGGNITDASIGDSKLDSSITLADFTNDVGFITSDTNASACADDQYLDGNNNCITIDDCASGSFLRYDQAGNNWICETDDSYPDTDTNASVCNDDQYLDGNNACVTIPDCGANQFLSYVQGTNTWSCTDSPAGGNTTSEIWAVVDNETFAKLSEGFSYTNITDEPWQEGTELYNTTAEMRAAINGSDTWLNSLGINTTSPGRTLQVNGDASVHGQLISNQEGGLYFGRSRISENQLALNNDSFGSTWTSTATSESWIGVALSSDGKYQTATINGGNIYISTDYGNTWTSKATSETWRHVVMSSDGKYQTAVVYGGNIYISTDYGNTWASKATSENWFGLAMSSDGRYQTSAEAGGGDIYISTDYGSTWTSKGNSGNWYGIAMSSDGKYQTAVPYGGNIYISTDYGNTWTSKATSEDWYDVAMSSDGRYQTATINNDYIYISTDYGNTWTSKGPISTDWRHVSMSSDGRYQTAAAYSNDNIYISTDYGNTWTSKATSQNWFAVDMSSDGKYQTAAILGGNIYVSYTDSYIYGGNVGIGTTSPSYRLEINDDDKALNVSNFLFANSTRVGIGDSSPTSALGVSGNITASDSLIATTGIDLAGDYRTSWPSGGGNTTSEIWAVVDNETFAKLSEGFSYTNITDEPWQEGTELYNTTAEMRTAINGSDSWFNNVGIGTASPGSYNAGADNLVVYENGDAGITIASGTTDNGYLLFADGTIGGETYRGGVVYYHTAATERLALFSGSSEKLTILSGGNIGIGNTGPDAKLHVTGGACIDTDDACTDPGDGNLTAFSLIATTGIDLAGDYRTSWPSGGGNTTSEIWAVVDNETFAKLSEGFSYTNITDEPWQEGTELYNTTAEMRAATNNSAEWSATAFTVMGAPGGTHILVEDYTGDDVLRLSGGATSSNLLFEVGDLDGQGGRTTFTLDDNDGEFIFAGGDVGIGTASPDNWLELYSTTVGTVLTEGIKINRAQSDTAYLVLNQYGGAAQLSSAYTNDYGEFIFNQYKVDTTDTREAMRISANGYVGIGDPSPDAPLEILSTTMPQFRISHTDGVDYGDFAVDSDGNLTISSSSGNVIIKLGI